MQTYRTETTVTEEKTVAVKDVPFSAGEKVEVIVRRTVRTRKGDKRYPLRGTVVHYAEPFEGIAEEDWEALK